MKTFYFFTLVCIAPWFCFGQLNGLEAGPGVSSPDVPSLAPTVVTTAATAIGMTTATLNGTVTANGASTSVTFDYGTTASYGSSVTGVPSVVTGTAATAVSAVLTGLLCNTLYHYRIKGTSTGGTSNGNDMTFTTSGVVGAAGTITGPAAVCAGGTGYIYSVPQISGATSYAWTLPSGATITSGSNTATITVSYTSIAVSGNVTVYGYNSCMQGTGSSLAVTVQPAVTPVITGPTPVCAYSTGNVYSTQAGMANYTWTVSTGGVITAGGTSTSNTVTVTWGGTGTQSVKVNYIDANGCNTPGGILATYPVTVNPLPVLAITGPQSKCVNSTGNIYVTEPGMTNYTWAVSSGGSITAGGTPASNTVTVTWTTEGTQTVSVNYTNSYGCNALSPLVKSVAVYALPVPTITGPATRCIGSTTNTAYSTQTGMTGYTWTVSSGGSIISGAGTKSVAVRWDTAGAQTVSVNYTNGNGCTAANPAVYNVTVYPLPVPVITGNSNVCAGSAGNIYTTQPGMSYYSWNVSSGGSITAGGTYNSNTVTVTWSSAGARTVSVNYMNGNSCFGAAPSVFNVTVTPVPAPTLTGPSPVCINSAGNVYSTEPGMTYYLWTVSNGGSVTAGGTTSGNSATITWTKSGTQYVTVNYTNTAGCFASSSVVKYVTVSSLPVPTITGPSKKCLGTPENCVYYTQSGMTGYVWNISSGGTLISGAGTNAIAVRWDSLGAQTVRVNYTNSYGCTAASPTVYNVTVYPLPVPVITGNASVCAGSTGNVYTTQPGMSYYTWTVSSGGSISSSGTNSGSSIIVTWTTPGARTVSVSYMNGNGCFAAVPTVFNVTVNALPVPVITGPDTVCAGTAGNLYATQGGMTGYTWTVPTGGSITSGTGTSAINVTWNSPGNQYVKVNYYNTSGCKAVTSTNFPVRVNEAPVPSITGNYSVCQGTTNVVYATQAGMTAYEWIVSAGGTVTAGGTPTSNTLTVTWSAAGAQTVKVKYTNASGCRAIQYATFQVNVKPLPVPTISGPSAVCQGSFQNNYYTQTGMTNYTWTVSSGGSITAGGTATKNYVTVNWISPGPQTVSVSYTATSGCAAAAPGVYNVAVSAGPVPTITGPASVCYYSTGNVYTTETGMTGYTWAVSPGGTITSGLGTSAITVSWTQTGSRTVTVNYTNPTGCRAVYPTYYAVTVNPRPEPTITGPSSVCAGSTGNVYTTQTGMSGYTWTISTGGSITAGAGTNAITVTWISPAPGTQTQFVRVNYSNSYGCTAFNPASFYVSVYPIPVPNISGTSSGCFNSTALYSTEPGMTGYTWTVSQGGSVLSGSGTRQIYVKWNNPGAQNLSVTYVGQGGCPVLNPTVKNVTINALPVPTITGSSSVCANALTTYSTEPGMTYYTWIVGGSGGIMTAGFNTSQVQVKWTLPGSKYLSVSYTDPNGCRADPPTTKNVTVTTCPDSPETGTGDIQNLIEFLVFPNPNAGLFTAMINYNSREICTLEVYNLLGVRIYESGQFNPDGEIQKEIDLRTFRNGIYTIVFRASGNQWTRRVIICK